MSDKKKVIIDCDNTMGKPCWIIDDGLAIFYTLGVPNLELIGITTTFGNSKIKTVMKHTKKLLKAIGREDIPLMEGASKKGDYSTKAAHFLADIVASNPGEITLLALGPLGNLRGAHELYPDFFKNLKGIILMGGIIKERLTIGRTKIKDVNLRRDHKAAYTVLNAECPVTIINCHICKQVPFTKDDFEEMDFWPKNLMHILKNSVWTDHLLHKIDHTILWDLLVPVYLTNQELFDKKPVRILASKEEDVIDGRLKISPEEKGTEVHMPSKVLDPLMFKKIVIESWQRFHETTSQKVKGYPGLKNNVFIEWLTKIGLKLLTPLGLRFLYKKEGNYYIEP